MTNGTYRIEQAQKTNSATVLPFTKRGMRCSRNYLARAAVENPTVAIDFFDTMKHNSAFAFFAPVGKTGLHRQPPFFEPIVELQLPLRSF